MQAESAPAACLSCTSMRIDGSFCGEPVIKFEAGCKASPLRQEVRFHGNPFVPSDIADVR